MCVCVSSLLWHARVEAAGHAPTDSAFYHTVQPSGGRWTADAMMRTQWAARQLAGSGGSRSGDLAHRAVSGASMASLRAVYGIADPHNKVPRRTLAACCAAERTA